MLKIKSSLGVLLTCCIAAGCSSTGAKAQAPAPNADGWVSLFDGKSLDGWKISENKDSFKVEEGAIVVNGNRAHLYYVGDDKAFVNFELQAEVMTLPNSNSGLYIHTQFQENGWPKFGYECQVNQTHSDPIKTGSLYNVVDVFKVNVPEGTTYSPGVRIDKNRVMLHVPEAPAKDNEWFTYKITVNGKRIITQVNGKTLVDYTEPDNKQAGNDFTRVLDKGTIAIQAHDPKSKVFFRSVQIKRLP